MQSFIITSENSGQTLLKFLQRFLKEAPSGLLHKQLRNKNITLNGKKAVGNEKLNVNDEIKIFMSDETISKFRGSVSRSTAEYDKAFSSHKNIKIVYEDKNVIIADKPVGMLSQKSGPSDVSINEVLIGYMLNKKETSGEKLASFTPSICNRLDRNTGGLILFGKTLAGTSFLNKAVKERTVHKFYRTIVFGKPEKPLYLKGYLSKDEVTNKVSISASPEDDGDYIETNVFPLKYSAENDLSELEIELITGKPHQIRAHLSSIGFPILGDKKYGNEALNRKFDQKSQFLYAVRLEFDENEICRELSGKTISIDISAKINEYVK